ncbi:hypothetical protein A6R68_20083, partial [Neotoma lepida]
TPLDVVKIRLQAQNNPFPKVTVISPLELIRTKMQSKNFSYKELHGFVSRKVSEDGWISLWKGWTPTILRDVPFS